MLEIHLDYHSSVPLYHQISDRVKQLIAIGQIESGDHLPTVRQMAIDLNVNQNTVVRAYLELERDQVVETRRGGGTIVSIKADDPALLNNRQKQLSNIINDSIINILSQGYSPEMLEAAFYLHLARWREERRTSVEEPADITDTSIKKNVLRIVGSHDLALDMLLNLLKHHDENIETEITYAGSLGGLIALQEERADLAGIHLLDEETGEYNYPYVKRVLPGREIAIVHLAYRIQGLMYLPGNPKQIKGLNDLQRPDVTFVNRQKGSGTRVLLDLHLKQTGIPITAIKGYEKEMDTHLAVGSNIVNGNADTGLGIEAASRSCNLEFLPLFRERYDLVIPMTSYRSKIVTSLLDLIVSDEFRTLVDQTGGYDTSQIGTTTFI